MLLRVRRRAVSVEWKGRITHSISTDTKELYNDRISHTSLSQKTGKIRSSSMFLVSLSNTKHHSLAQPKTSKLPLTNLPINYNYNNFKTYCMPANHLHQVNGVNGGDTENTVRWYGKHVRCSTRVVCVCVCLSVCVQRTGQSDQFKTVSYGLQLWHACFYWQSTHDPLKFFRNGGVCKKSLGKDMRCHERLLVTTATRFLCSLL